MIQVFALLLLLAVPAANAAVVDGIAGVVDSSVITRSQVDQLVAAEAKKRGAEVPTRAQALELLIEQELLAKEAARLGVTVTDADVERAINDVRTRNNLGPDDFRAALAAQGIAYDAYAAELRGQILKIKVAGPALRARLQMDEAALREYYLKHIADFCELERVRLKHFSVADRTAAEAARARLAAGEDLGPKGLEDMGLLAVDNLSDGIRQAVQGVPAKGVTPVLELGGSCHVFVVEERRDRSVKPYEEVADLVKDRYFAEQEEVLYRTWMDGLKERARIERKL